MEKTLAEQLQDVIDALHVAEAKAQTAAQTMRKQRFYFGLGLNHPDAEIARLIRDVRYTKRLAERQKTGGVPAHKRAASSAQKPAQKIDGRLVRVSDAGNELVVNPVQDATALPAVLPDQVLPEQGEGLGAVGDGTGVGAITEPPIIQPVISQPAPDGDAPAVEQGKPDDMGGA